MKGLSTDICTTSSAACLKAAGYEFVVRYYSSTTKLPEKVITAGEALALSQNGISICVVYEDLSNIVSYFNGARGKVDGYNAYHFAQNMHQPPGSAIYFAVDYDAELADIPGAIQDYFKGILQGFNDFSGGNPVYDIGVYGSGAVCRWLKNNLVFVKYTWLAESTGWQGSASYEDWNLKQSVNSAALCLLGNNWEPCIANGDFGQFTPGFV